LASPVSPPRFVRDEAGLAGVLFGLKLTPCPRCRQTGALIGHGYLRGYAERSGEEVVRGRRAFCSNRGQRPGCGRTFSVLLSTVLAGFVVRTLTLFCFARAVLSGLTRRAAWLREAGGAPSLSSGYRLWRRLSEAQATLRARLCRVTSPPDSAAREPLAQLLQHVVVVVGTGEADPFSALQSQQQQGLLGR
jgi:hypothetical protein